MFYLEPLFGALPKRWYHSKRDTSIGAVAEEKNLRISDISKKSEVTSWKKERLFKLYVTKFLQVTSYEVFQNYKKEIYGEEEGLTWQV